MTATDGVVIVGAGLAGASAAFGLRKGGYDRPIVLIGSEERIPYERPPMSKGYLRGAEPFEKAQVRPVEEYAASQIDLRLGRTATALDVSTKRVMLDDGTELPYDTVILATGSAARPLDVPNATLPGAHSLRTVEDADSLRAAAMEAGEIVVIGSGWIGSEVSASLRELDRAVTLVSHTPRPLERVLGSEVAEAYLALHLEHGVRVVHGSVQAIEGSTEVEGVRLADGSRFAADLVVAGVGAVPRIGLAQAAGLELTDGGIAVDEHLRASAADVYAIGDIAAAWHPRYGRHIRIEHWDNAKRQGAAVATTILGGDEPYVRVPYFYSDQFDLGMEYRGYAPQWGRAVIRGDLAAREFHAFWLADSRVIAAMNANLWDDGKALARLVASEERVDPDRLADTSIPLAEIAGR